MPQKILVNKPITSYCVGMSKIDFLSLYFLFIFSLQYIHYTYLIQMTGLIWLCGEHSTQVQ